MKLGWQPSKWLKKKAKAGFRGYPVRTIAFYMKAVEGHKPTSSAYSLSCSSGSVRVQLPAERCRLP